MKKITSAILLLTMLGNLTACGSLLYPERVGQKSTGKLDVKVVLLDGIGLFFFLVPGVIAYAVDFINGTIYLPHVHASYDENGKFKKEDMVAINVGKENLTAEKIKEVISQHTGKNIENSTLEKYAVDKDGNKVRI